MIKYEIALLLICIFLGVLATHYINETSRFRAIAHSCNSAEMGKNLTYLDFYAGKYFHDDYYCVWVKDMPAEEISTTEIHEQCHVLVDKDYAHFCK